MISYIVYFGFFFKNGLYMGLNIILIMEDNILTNEMLLIIFESEFSRYKRTYRSHNLTLNFKLH